MEEFDLIIVGTGSAMNIVEPLIGANPHIRIAVIEKDEPGGICLTRGCIPSKIMVYPAELLRLLDNAQELGLEVTAKSVNYEHVMTRMRSLIDRDINAIREGLRSSRNISFYQGVAKFVAPYTLSVGGKTIKGRKIVLATGSRPLIPPIKGLENAGYQTSDSVIRMALKKRPESLIIIGGGYIAAEFGHFFSATGTKVVIVGRNKRFLPEEEPEVSQVVKSEMSKHLEVVTGCEVAEVGTTASGTKRVTGHTKDGKELEFEAQEILVASGRAPENDILDAAKGGIELTEKGWIATNEYLETSQPNVWALGDANGKFLFKHKANYESYVVYYNAFQNQRIAADYHAVPHAVFTHPEVASVGLGEERAIREHGKDKVLIGFQRYEDTAKGEAMGVHGYFAKVIVHAGDYRILGAHVVGPHASILIQELVTLMYTQEHSVLPVTYGMHIHPALSEVIERACTSLMGVDEYHHLLRHHFGIAVDDG